MIRELLTESDLVRAFPVMQELTTSLTEESFLALIPQMRSEGYQLFALEMDDQIVALAGVARMTNLYYGRHVLVYDLVTASHARSKGYGEQLLLYVEEWGRQQGCGYVTLNSGTRRTRAHEFYERMGYERPLLGFTKALK